MYTVHDLRNPHHRDRAEHDAQLDVIIPAADAVITLTDGAAYEIKRRWARRAIVLSHPHVVDFETMRGIQHARLDGQRDRARHDDAGYRIGLHLKSLRANMNAVPVIASGVSASSRLSTIRASGTSGRNCGLQIISLTLTCPSRRSIGVNR